MYIRPFFFLQLCKDLLHKSTFVPFFGRLQKKGRMFEKKGRMYIRPYFFQHSSLFLTFVPFFSFMTFGHVLGHGLKTRLGAAGPAPRKPQTLASPVTDRRGGIQCTPRRTPPATPRRHRKLGPPGGGLRVGCDGVSLWQQVLSAARIPPTGGGLGTYSPWRLVSAEAYNRIPLLTRKIRLNKQKR